MKELAYKFSVGNPCFHNSWSSMFGTFSRAKESFVMYAKCSWSQVCAKINCQDIPMTCTQSAQPPSRTCMMGVGFEISRLAIIDKVQLTVKYAVARCGTSLYKAVWNFRFWSYVWPEFYLDPLIDACQCAWSFDFTLIAVADGSTGHIVVTTLVLTQCKTI